MFNPLHMLHIATIINAACAKLEPVTPAITIQGELLKTNAQQELLRRPEITGAVAPIYEVLLKDKRMLKDIGLEVRSHANYDKRAALKIIREEKKRLFATHTNAEGTHYFCATGKKEENLLYAICLADDEITKRSCGGRAGPGGGSGRK